MSAPSLFLDAARRLPAHRGGNAAVAFGLALIPVAAAAGAAVDYMRAADTRAKLQAIADAPVLNGLRAPASQRVGSAEAHTRSAVKGAGLALDQLSFAPTANQGLRGRVKVGWPRSSATCSAPRGSTSPPERKGSSRRRPARPGPSA